MAASRTVLLRLPSRRRSCAVITAFWIGVFTLVPGSVSGRSNEADFKLAPGGTAFWAGENVDLAQVRDPDLCGTAGDCWDYRLDLARGGAQLRVSLAAHLQDPGDVRPWPDNIESAPEMLFTVQLIDPAGEIVSERATQDALNFVRGYAVELFVHRPMAGVWTVRVIPTSVMDMAFRMRAQLEAREVTTKEQRTVPLPPNLRIIPPFEFNFNNSSATWRPGVGTPGLHASCMVEEVAESIREGFSIPQLCLRFSIGLENVGGGPLWLLMTNDGDDAILTQRVFASDGTFREKREGAAGRAEWDVFHGHYHYQNAYRVALLAPEDPEWTPGDGRPKLIPMAPGRKLGFGPGNEFLADWRRFYQGDPQYYYDSGDGYDGDISIQTGWGDIYEWNRSGNYVDFPQALPGMPQPGFYVLRGITDQQGVIVESNESDNTSYAFIEVSQLGEVTLVERGYGLDPWDAKKTVLDVAP
ncbi:MAG TPA: hypothetical protein VG408_07615 [Actinomycetota bacterium]|nr:hypothetical protein [Actinomycetota bacterium]